MSISSTDESLVDTKDVTKETKKSKKKQYRCDQCLKVFNRPSALKTHIYTHTGEKPYSCSSQGCDRRFSVISNLRRHLKVHKKPANRNKMSPEERERQVRLLMSRSAQDLSLPSTCQPFDYMPALRYPLTTDYNLYSMDNLVYYDQSLTDNSLWQPMNRLMRGMDISYL
ncbi:hypothetical protein BY458DRAFT_440865 [Sporodiniella umbellata]|nr:hypothetical protein BY458DRAFT_440865 [Sporodiniella umbellata]